MIYQDRDLRMLLVENAPPAFPPAADILANGDAAIFGLADCARLREAKCDVFATGKPTRLELALEDRGTDSLWFEVHIEPDRDAETIRGLFVAISDISDIKRRELTLRSLLFEVSHRAHNMLTILQALISLTARQSGSIADFETKFRGRIASLALSQDSRYTCELGRRAPKPPCGMADGATPAVRHDATTVQRCRSDPRTERGPAHRPRIARTCRERPGRR